jgi:hypothetical protein
LTAVTAAFSHIPLKEVLIVQEKAFFDGGGIAGFRVRGERFRAGELEAARAG